MSAQPLISAKHDILPFLLHDIRFQKVRMFCKVTATNKTRSSAVAKRPRDASCLYSFYTLEWCGYPMVNKFEHMFIRFDMIHEREKNRREFHVPQPTFLFPLETPLRLSRNMLHGWRQFNACQTPRSMYLSIFKSFQVIRCLSQCVSLKIAIFTTFSFPLRTPLGQSR